jgi:hypothetical protein
MDLDLLAESGLQHDALILLSVLILSCQVVLSLPRTMQVALKMLFFRTPSVFIDEFFFR